MTVKVELDLHYLHINYSQAVLLGSFLNYLWWQSDHPSATPASLHKNGHNGMKLLPSVENANKKFVNLLTWADCSDRCLQFNSSIVFVETSHLIVSWISSTLIHWTQVWPSEFKPHMLIVRATVFISTKCYQCPFIPSLFSRQSIKAFVFPLYWRIFSAVICWEWVRYKRD